MLLGRAFEEFNAGLVQRNRNLHGFFAERELLRRGQEILDDGNLAERLTGVSGFPAHKFVYLYANILH